MTIGDLLTRLQKLKTRSEAASFLIEVTKDNPNAWTNIKYVTGYLGNAERNRIMELFK